MDCGSVGAIPATCTVLLMSFCSRSMKTHEYHCTTHQNTKSSQVMTLFSKWHLQSSFKSQCTQCICITLFTLLHSSFTENHDDNIYNTLIPHFATIQEIKQFKFAI